MKAYMKDIEGKADYSSTILNEEMGVLSEGGSPKLAALPPKRLWIEAKDEHGHTYYYHSITYGI